MNICMMTNTYLPHVGGVARSVHTFAKEFREHGHNVLVVAPTFPEAGGSNHGDERGVVRLPAIQQFNGSDFSVRLPLTALFNTTIDSFQANIIHSHHPFLLGDTALRVAANKHVPVVFTHHTLYEEYTHYVPLDSPALKQFTIELSTQYANLCDAVIAPSESIAQLIEKRGVEVPIEIIPTGINVEEFASGRRNAFRKALGIPSDAFVVGHVGRLALEKNLDYLSRAVCRFLKQSPEAICLLVGAGPLEDEIRTIFAAERLTERLRMPGKKTGQDLFDAYAAMDVFVFSSFSETQGLVVAEAMAAGVPVVALDAPGVREVVRAGKNGYLLDADTDQNSFATCLQDLKSKPEMRKELGVGAKRTAVQFSSEKSAEKAVALYERVRNQTRPQRRVEKADAWMALQKRMELEWSLIAQKTKAAVNALFAENDSPVENRDLPA
jgi:1,2-diacylglycerol 3-alpha-glucosyltransferase